MYIDNLGPSQGARLQQVLQTLKGLYGTELAVDMQASRAPADLEEMRDAWQQTRDSIIAESSFNSYQRNPDYTKAMLVLEAVGLMLKEIAPGRARRRNIKESTTQDDSMAIRSTALDERDEKIGRAHV